MIWFVHPPKFPGKHIPLILCENFYLLRRELPKPGFRKERERTILDSLDDDSKGKLRPVLK